ncbi:MAG: NAD(P)-binding domain-containing protein, partial [Actinomycetota bacterium]|nr:NAD(P)-binding domain-containing protein [Actinomycetota bacterium]
MTDSERESKPFELAVVGGGNMGAALVGGLLAAGGVEAQSVVICEALEVRRDKLAEMFPGVAITEEVPPCSAAVLAVKPGDIPEAARTAVLAGARRILSIAAGVPTASIERVVERDV